MGGAAALGATVAYGVTHALWFQSAVWENIPERRVDGRRAFDYRFEQGKSVAYTFSLRNDGLADVTVIGVEAPSVGLLHLTGFRGSADTSFTRPTVPGGSSFALPSRDDRFLTLVFRLSGCGGQGSREAAVVTHVTVRYRVLGATQSQYVPLVPGPATRCP